MRLSAIAALGLVAGAGRPSSSGAMDVEFERDLLPVLQERCFGCHAGLAAGGPRKPKGGLRLDGAGWILRGGKSGEAVVPGDPDHSPLFELIDLDADDPDVMPAKGDLLSEQHKRMFRQWITAGADFGGWMGAAGPAGGTRGNREVELHRRLLVYRQLGQGLEPVSRQVLARTLGEEGRSRPVLPGSPLLRVDFLSREALVTDDVLERLRPIARNIAILDLARTKISDAGLQNLKGMRHLVELSLAETRIGDRAVTVVKSLPALRSLNLHGTAVGEAALEALGDAPALEHLYLWRTRASRAAVEQLIAGRPDLEVHMGLGLPDLEPPRARRKQRSRGRRGK